MVIDGYVPGGVPTIARALEPMRLSGIEIQLTPININIICSSDSRMAVLPVLIYPDERLNSRGHVQSFDCEGFEARAIQHELDHLDGFLFLDRLVSRRELFRRKAYK